MKVFISSTVRGLESFRDAAAKAARVLKHDVTRAEDLGASADSPRRVCLASVRRADVTVLILGARYGDPQGAHGLSPTHEEYREARDHGGVLVFIQADVTRELRQEEFLREVQQWSHGQYTATFSTADELKDAVTGALHDFELSRKAGVVDEAELVTRARALVPDTRGMSSAPRLAITFCGGPRQQVLRPGQVESKELAKAIQQEALFGKSPVLDSEGGTKATIRKGQLILEQDEASVLVTELGDVRVIQGVDRENGDHFLVLVEEDIQDSIEHAIRFGGWLLDHLDSKRRLSSIAVIASLMNGGYLGWMTRKERAKSRGSVTVGMRGDKPVMVQLTPAVRPRAALLSTTKEIAEDLTVLLRRELKA